MRNKVNTVDDAQNSRIKIKLNKFFINFVKKMKKTNIDCSRDEEKSKMRRMRDKRLTREYSTYQ